MIYTKWLIGFDSSLRPDVPDSVGDRPMDQRLNEPGYGWNAAPVEIATPVLRPLDDDWKDKIETAISTVLDLFGEDNVYVNDSCGLHVHVGNEYKGFPLSTYKKLGILLYAYERSINCFHPPHRVFENAHCRPLNQELADNGRCTADPPGLTDLATIALRLQQASGWQEFLERFNPNAEYLAYNFCHYSTKRTVEFRQHCGTLDTGRIGIWVDFCCALVRFAHAMAPSEAIGVVLDRLEGRNECDMLEFLYLMHEWSLAEQLGSDMYRHDAAYDLPERTLNDLEVPGALQKLRATYDEMLTLPSDEEDEGALMNDGRMRSIGS
jgi:hypothetical protein